MQKVEKNLPNLAGTWRNASKTQQNMQKTLQITLEHAKTETMRKSFEKHVKTAQNAKITTNFIKQL